MAKLVILESISGIEYELYALAPDYATKESVNKALQEAQIEAFVSAGKEWNETDLRPALAKRGIIVQDMARVISSSECWDRETGEVGRLWWIADNEAELEDWKKNWSGKPIRVVKTEKQSERYNLPGCEKIDVIFELPMDQASELLGYEVEESEWLEEEDQENSPCANQ